MRMWSSQSVGNPSGSARTVTVRVECYAGRKGDERPVRFHLGDQPYEVDEILDQWYGPSATFFKVQGSDGNLYVLRRSEPQGEWSLEAFRRLVPG